MFVDDVALMVESSLDELSMIEESEMRRVRCVEPTSDRSESWSDAHASRVELEEEDRCVYVRMAVAS